MSYFRVTKVEMTRVNVKEVASADMKASISAPSLEELLKEFTFSFFGSGKHKITWDELFSLREAVLLDVRSQEEVKMISVSPGSSRKIIHIPINEIPDRVQEIPADRVIAIFCSAGIRAAIVYVYLRTLGFPGVRVLTGGLSDLVEYTSPDRIWKREQSSRTDL